MANFISVDFVKDAMGIGKIVKKQNIDGFNLKKSDPKGEIANPIYNSVVLPQIITFKKTHKKTPNLILGNFLNEFRNNNSLSDDFVVSNSHFYKQVVNSYVWGCIYRNDDNPTPPVSYSAQLYVLINSEGIRFGLCYGDGVKDKDDIVRYVINSDKAKKVIEKLVDAKAFMLFNDGDARISPKKKDAMDTADIDKWHRSFSIIKYFNGSDIPTNIEELIIDAFNKLLPLFKAIVYGDDSYIQNHITTANTVKQPPIVYKDIKERLSFDLNKKFETDSLHFEDYETITTQISSAIKNNKHIILLGPPGTGKSKLAQLICECFSGEYNYVMTTATSDWSTYETIGGYRIVKDEEGLIFSPGLFLQCFQDKAHNPINKWLIIDELNRADIDKAFGYLFSALTGDDIVLPYEKHGEQVEIIGKPKDETLIMPSKYIIHSDWRIVATMNTFDKTSLYEMSYAFMRRFAFIPIDVPIEITEDLIKKYCNIWAIKIDNSTAAEIAKLWGAINSIRKIGPAIIQDIIKHVGDKKDYTGAISMYVLSQLEGLSEQKQRMFFNSLEQLSFISKLDQLKKFASDIFEVDLRSGNPNDSNT